MTEPLGRRERNKQEKLRRITSAAQDLLAEHTLDEITTQQVADRADVATGTLFLYARSKGELLLLAHNADYEQALQRGIAAAATATGARAAVLTIVEQVVACNRAHVENGRSYLREMVFGDPTEPHHAEALRLSRATEAAIAACLVRLDGRSEEQADVSARVVTAVMLLAMASPLAIRATVDEVVADVDRQLDGLVRS